MKKWLMTKSIAVKLSLALAAVLVVAGVGTGIYLGVKPASTPAQNEVVAIDDDTAPLTDAPETAEEPVKEDETVTEVVETPEVVEEEIIEEIRFKEGYDLVNGNFAEGIFGYEVYAMNSGDIIYDTNESGFTIRISDTGTEDWHVQLKQNDVRLEQGRWYRLSIDAKSDINRTITMTMQHDGTNDDNWNLYAPQKKLDLGNNWQRYSIIFCMNEATDNHAVFNVSMGTVDGRRITTNHAISLNNITLEALPSNFIDSMRSGDNLIANPNFAYEDITWDANIVAPGQATASFAGGAATFNIANPGSVDWHVQLKQAGIKLEANTGYHFSFNVSSTATRIIKIGIMDTNYVTWYGGGDITVGPGSQNVSVDFFNTYASNDNALLMISMGQIEGVATPASTITMSNFYMGKDSGVTVAANGGSAGGANPTTVLGSWEVYDHECGHTAGSYIDSEGNIVINMTNLGTEAWHAQMTNKSFNLEKGKTYTISFEGKSTVARDITYQMQRDGSADNNWTTYSSENKASLTTEWDVYSQSFTMPVDNNGTIFNFSFGRQDQDDNSEVPHTIYIRNIKFEEVVKQPIATVTKNDENKGEFVINPAEYGVEEPNGKVLKIAVTLRSTGMFKGAIGGNVPTGWAQSEGFESTNGEEMTWEYTLDSYVDFVKADFWYIAGEKVEVMDVTVEEIVDPIAVIYPNSENKSEFVINPADYGVEEPEGKILAIKVRLRSDAMFKGAIGGNVPSGWVQSSGYESANGATMTWEYTLDSYTDFVKADIWYMAGSSIEILDVKVSVAEASEGSDDAEEADDNIIKVNSNKGEYTIDPVKYGIENPAGKKLTFKATLKADAMFKGTIAGNSPAGWAQGQEYISENGEEMTWEYTLEYVDYVKVDIWWANATEIEVLDVQVTEAAVSETPATPEEPETPEESANEPVVINVADQVIGVGAVKTADGNWEYKIESGTYAELEGKKVKFSADLQSASYFGGKIIIQSHPDYSGWNASEQIGVEATGEVSHWEVVADDYKQAFIQIYWRDEEYNPSDINITNITLEVVDEEEEAE